MNLPPLEPTDDKAQPAFRDAASCTAWLNQLQLTNLHQAHTSLRNQIDQLNRLPMRGSDRLQTLEALREIVAVMQGDYAKKLIGKKLPFANEDMVLLYSLLALWQSMSVGYQRCLQSWQAGDKSLASSATLVMHRSLRYAVLQAYEYLRIGYEPDAKFWQQLHALYAFAETHNLHAQPVADDRYSRGQPNTVRTLYALALLASHATCANLSRSQWQLLDRWLNAWGDSTLTIEPRCSISKGDAQPLAVDLASPLGLQTLNALQEAPTVRYLAMVPLSKLIRVKTILLQQGQTTEKLELGTELSSKDATELLNLLHKCWCEEPPKPPRDAPMVQVCYGLEELYAQVAKKPFKPLAKAADKAAIQQIEAFGRVLTDTNRHNLTQLGFVPEEWEPEEAIGLLGTRLVRKEIKGDRVALNQVIGVRVAGKEEFSVGTVKSAQVDHAGRLHIAVRFLPGQPQALIVRGGTVHEPSANTATPGVLLPEMSNLRIPASLLLPRDWFQPGRSLEIVYPDNKKQAVTLGISVEKGSDYERVSFTPKG